MKSFSVYISEALDKPYPLKWVKPSWPGADLDQSAVAKTADGGKLTVFFEMVGTNDNLEYDINFTKANEGDDEEDPGTTLATGQGDEFRIMATVKKAIEEWWSKYGTKKKINKIRFQASKDPDDSLVKRRDVLYTRLAKQFANKTKYKLQIRKEQYAVIFILERPRNK